MNNTQEWREEKKDDYVGLYERCMAEMVDWYTHYSGGVSMLRRIGVVMASASHATYTLQLLSKLWNFLEDFLCSVCCSRIGLEE